MSVKSFRRAVLSGAACAVAGLLAAGPAAHAQRIGAQDDEETSAQRTRETPAMRETVYQKLSEAQICAEENEDYVCARELLEEVRAMRNLTGYETAQMWSFYAYIYFSEGNYPEAIVAYENVLKQEPKDLTVALETSTLYTLATLYVQEERYEEGLEKLNRWFEIAENPGPTAYILKAQIYYSMGEYANGIQPVVDALRIAADRGTPPEEGWYQLLNVFYFETENFPKVIETLTILVENWPKAEYMIQLAAVYGQEGDDLRQLALFQAAYEGGWLERGTDIVTLAQMLLQAQIPHEAALILEKGLEDGTIESNQSNWRLFAQALQLAQEDEAALPALARASSLADDGDLDHRLAQSYVNLARWEECAEAARDAIRRGGLSRPDQVNLLLGNCLVELKEYSEAREAFAAAARDDRSRSAANQWLDYIEGEEQREREISNSRRNL